MMPDASAGYSVGECMCVNAESLNTLPHNVYQAAQHYAPSLAFHYLSCIRRWDYLPSLDLTDLEKLVLDNVIAPTRDSFQSALYDFLSQPELTLLHENILSPSEPESHCRMILGMG